ncbi:hypothetical protein IZ6_00210 [Terrihabitans soli]|uniref:Histidine phosphatase family protein n=1 Tax=Terrihabitans soli TaxID=708113 RepID=A0A6S6QJB4_9HYPH|nr:flagellar basal body-associated protein FliL [Terrihabitans soli]BCJ89286.1 hypothetical protein IZ6_00210 [Terrihabitans soli]
MRALSTLSAALAALLLASVAAEAGPKNATVMIIRHAEDADSGPGISAAGQARAQSYAGRGWPGGRPSLLIAASDSKKSQRPRLTLLPLSRAIGIPVNAGFNDENPNGVARYLSNAGAGKTTLIAWRREEMPQLISALGGNPSSFLPGGGWPKGVHNWTVVLKFDASGNVVPGESRLVR